MRFALGSLVLAGSLLAAATPLQAMYLSPHGKGEVLLFPYYTVNANQATLVSIVNSTARAKLLHITFREGYNSRLVLDFDIALAPHDSWTGTVFADADTGFAQLLTRDGSCTLPAKEQWTAALPGGGYRQRFIEAAYTGDSADGGPATLERTREGHIQVIERAELDGATAAALAQSPPACRALQQLPPGSPDIDAPGGGLYGNFAVVDVAEGTLFGGAATAVDDFSQVPLVNDTGSVIEWLAAGNSRANPPEVDAVVAVGAGRSTLTWSTLPQSGGPANAITALLMADSVHGAMSRESGVGSDTEWILTAPTKFLHTDVPSALAPLAPFDSAFNSTNTAGSCSRFVVSGHDREGRAVQFLQDPELSAIIPGAHPQHALCYATTVVHFSDLPANGRTPLLGSRLAAKVWNPMPAVETANVTLVLGVRDAGARNVLPPGLRGPGLIGLPVIGLEAVRYINGNVAPGVLANYTMATPLRSNVLCSGANGVSVPCS